jgi:hypothetical protein
MRKNSLKDRKNIVVENKETLKQEIFHQQQLLESDTAKLEEVLKNVEKEEVEIITKIQPTEKLDDILNSHSTLENIDIDEIPRLPLPLPLPLPAFVEGVYDPYRESLIGNNPPTPENISIFGVEIDGIDGKYLFYIVSKFVLFDRRYINYNVYKKVNGRWVFLYSLVAYTSSSQVGSWRLCITEAGNRLNKFDDYVQSTTLHYKICQKMCELYYDPRLLWANEPVRDTPDGPVNNETQARNAARNPIVQGVQSARDYDPFVMEGGAYQYLSYPEAYSKTNPNYIITGIVRGRGIPDIFNFWSNNVRGKCGDKDYIVDGQLTILSEQRIIKFLDEFSGKLSDNYTPRQHAFLYNDHMTYNTPTDRKRFSSEATIFLIRSEKNPDSDKLLHNYHRRSEYPQFIDQICVFYKMRQENENGDVELDVAGSYAQSMPLPLHIVNQLGLYLFYYKGGPYICKPLEYSSQCRVMEYAAPDKIIPIEILENYKFVGFRYSAHYPFYEIYDYDKNDKNIIDKYREGQAIIRTLPIKTDDDLASITATNPAAAVAAIASVQGMPRFLTIQYPFLRRDLEAVQRVIIPQRDLEPGPGLKLSETGKNHFLTLSITADPANINIQNVIAEQPQPQRSNSFNKILLYGKNLLHNAQIKLSGFFLKDVPTELNSVPVISISGGQKTNKTKNKKQYKNKLQTYKRKKCKQQKIKRKTKKNHKKRTTKKRSL